MLQNIQKWMESAYRLESRTPVSHYLIDHPTVLSYLGKDHPLVAAEEVLLVTGANSEFELGLYLHPSILRSQGREDVERRSHRWLTAAEGVSHWLLVSERLSQGQELTQLELELQGEIDKFFFARLGAQHLELLPHYHLERPASLEALHHGHRQTYETARRLAQRYCHQMMKEYLCGRSFDGLFEELRRFYRLSHWQKLKRIGCP